MCRTLSHGSLFDFWPLAPTFREGYETPLSPARPSDERSVPGSMRLYYRSLLRGPYPTCQPWSCDSWGPLFVLER